MSFDIEIHDRTTLEQFMEYLKSKFPNFEVNFKPEGDVCEFIYKSFEKTHYQTVCKTYINTINIKIYDQNYNLVKFNTGQITIKLHFQKRKKLVFILLCLVIPQADT